MLDMKRQIITLEGLYQALLLPSDHSTPLLPPWPFALGSSSYYLHSRTTVQSRQNMLGAQTKTDPTLTPDLRYVMLLLLLML